MSLSTIVRQAYRLYGLGVLIWAVWSGVWVLNGLSMDPNVVGTGWLVLAASGAVLGIVMLVLRYSSDFQLFMVQEKRSRIQRFNNHILGSTPLHFYALGLVAWSFVTIGFVVGLGPLERTIVGVGWLLIALYGFALATGLAVKHQSDLIEEIEEVTSAELKLDGS